MLVYATPNDLAVWTGHATPSNALQLLRSASLAVREATELCFYAVDSDGFPSEYVKLQAFRDATCAQAAFLAANDIDPFAGLQPGVESSTKIGTASIVFADADMAAEAKQAALGSIVIEAQRILRDAGVLPTDPWVVG